MQKNAVEGLGRDSRQDFPMVVATMPASTRERRAAFGLIILLLAVFLVLAPLASMPLAHVDAFIPVLQTVLCFAELTTAILLFAQYSVLPLRGLLALASGYMFSGLFAFLQTLAFPGAYGPAGVIGNPLSSAPYLFILWHLTFPLEVIVYALSRDTVEDTSRSGRSTKVIIGITVACTLILTAASTWAVTAGAPFLPNLFVDLTRQAPIASYLTGFLWLLSAVALALLFVRKRTSLAVWLMVTVFATLPDLALSTVMAAVRFTFGWYTARSYSLIASFTVLSVLLAETTVLYGRLASAMALQRRERADRLMTVEAATSAMAHEIRQPLTGIASHGAAAMNWLKRTPPDLEKASACVESIVDSSHRADEIIASIRGLFKKTDSQRDVVHLNDLAQQILRVAQPDLLAHKVSVTTEYQENIPQINADHIQLQQVILNLIKNAIDAMDATTPDKRRLRLLTGYNGSSVVSLYIQDSGPGITTEDQDSIFAAFFTTKSTGMGLGLSICRTIVEDHGGTLNVAKTDSRGTSFEIALPIRSTNDMPAE
jgi:signal transduction histidine kinase